MNDFQTALTALKAGEKVARAGWQGTRMWIALGSGTVALEAEKFWNRHSRAFAEANGGTATVSPYIIMKTAQETIQMGWTPSQADLLADDWEIVA